MPLQTARLEISLSIKDGWHAQVHTPDGSVSFPLGHLTTLPNGAVIHAVFQPKPEAKPPRVAIKKQKRASVRQENEVMEALGGRRHPGSGALPGLKGDGSVRNKYRVEMKMTRKGSFRLERSDLGKIRGECQGTEKPVLVLDFVDPETGGSPDRWALIPFELLLKMDPHYQPPSR